MKARGRIVKIISNLYSVDVAGTIYEARARGKFRNDEVTPLVGDFVVIDTEDKYILEIEKRRNYLNRPMIANTDVGLIITSVKDPDLSLNLLDKELLVVSNAGIEPVIVLTKMDLLSGDKKKEIKKIFDYYRKLGVKVFTNKEIFKLKWFLRGKVIVLTGQTGAGKSTLLNKFDKDLNLATSPISKALGRGVHTTRHVELFKIGGMYIADTPGFSALDLNFSKETLKSLYPEFKGVTCKFQDCSHAKEKGCGVIQAVEDGKILKSRYENYLKFRGEVK